MALYFEYVVYNKVNKNTKLEDLNTLYGHINGFQKWVTSDKIFGHSIIRERGLSSQAYGFIKTNVLNNKISLYQYNQYTQQSEM